MPRKDVPVSLLADLVEAMEKIAPISLAQPWDNVGLLAGDPQQRCTRVLLCVDLTPAVLEEAIAGRYHGLVVYHPPIFRPITRLCADSDGPEALVQRAVAAGLGIYSPHTAWDAAPGGTNDVLAELCGLGAVEPFEYPQPPGRHTKVVTFVPAGDVDRVAAYMAAAGAGQIGEYRHCSFRSAGQGTFYGTESTRPKVGQRGRLEKVEEIRLEMIAPNERLPEVVDALLRGHPYEEPAYDLYPLAAPPTFGIGRVGLLPPKTTLGSLADRLGKATGSRVLSVVGRRTQPLRRAAVCAGSAGRLPLEKPRAARCDVVVTGELHHHEALALLRAGKTAVVLGHWESERPALRPLAGRLERLIPALHAAVSRQDRSPLGPA